MIDGINLTQQSSLRIISKCLQDSQNEVLHALCMCVLPSQCHCIGWRTSGHAWHCQRLLGVCGLILRAAWSCMPGCLFRSCNQAVAPPFSFSATAGCCGPATCHLFFLEFELGRASKQHCSFWVRPLARNADQAAVPTAGGSSSSCAWACLVAAPPTACSTPAGNACTGRAGR